MSDDFYDEIWNPVLQYVQHFMRTNPKRWQSYLRLTRDLNRFAHALAGKELRARDHFSDIDWPSVFHAYERKRMYGARYLFDTPFWCATTGWENLWSAYCLSHILGHETARPRAYVELGCGYGKLLFDIHKETLDNGIRLLGVDLSRIGVDCANLVFSLLDRDDARPFTSVTAGNISSLAPNQFDCGGLDAVIFSVSALNKVETLPNDLYAMIRSSLRHAGCWSG